MFPSLHFYIDFQIPAATVCRAPFSRHKRLAAGYLSGAVRKSLFAKVALATLGQEALLAHSLAW